MTIDAKKARELARVPDQEVAREKVKAIESDIEKAAKDGKRMVYLCDNFWSYGGYNSEPTWKAAVKILEDRGFTVKFRYMEYQFVDMGTEVHW